MPLNVDDFLSQGDEFTRQHGAGSSRAPRTGDSGKTAAEYDGLFSPVAAGQRNTTLTRYVGMLRRRLPIGYEAALHMCSAWNDRYCDPPLAAPEVDDVVGRAWYDWAAADDPDFTPADVKATPEKPAAGYTLLTVNDLLDLEAAGKGLEWLVEGVLVKQGIHFVSAPAAGAKSWLMLDLGRCMAQGLPWLDQFDLGRGAVLYIDEEMGEAKTSTRIKKLGFGRDTPFYYIGKKGIRLDSAGDRTWMLEMVKQHDIKLICLDTLTGLISGLRENDNEHVSKLRSYFNPLTEAGATLLVAHHDRKGGQGDSSTPHERMAGGRDLAAMADMAYALDKQGGVFHLSVTKNRWTPDDEAVSVDFALEDNEDRTQTTLRVLSANEAVQVNHNKTEETLEKRILDVLSLEGAMSTNTLVSRVKGAPAHITTVAKRMAAEGRLQVTKDKQSIIYSLADNDGQTGF